MNCTNTTINNEVSFDPVLRRFPTQVKKSAKGVNKLGWQLYSGFLKANKELPNISCQILYDRTTLFGTVVFILHIMDEHFSLRFDACNSHSEWNMNEYSYKMIKQFWEYLNQNSATF